jgi:hypothetical protein
LTEGRHVFIVGLPRTGTTITREVLNTSTRVGIGGESKFLPDRALLGFGARPGFRQQIARVGDLRTDAGLREVVDYIYSQQESRYWARLAGELPRDAFESRLRESERTDRALFDIAMEHFARGKPLRGDKSPQHIHSVPLLLEWFPEARVIHTFRDPRAVYVSVQKKSEQRKAAARGLQTLISRIPAVAKSYSATSVIWHWRRAIALHREYETRYPDQYTLVRFEDLMADPATVINRLCAFIAVPFDQSMLDQVVLNSSFMPRGAATGFDARVVGRWREHLSPVAARWFMARCGRELTEFGYSP